MRIIFICGCIEPSKNGVGDYTRRLAAELMKNDNETAIVSINDPYVSKPVLEYQEEDVIRVPTYRLPSIKYISYAKTYVEGFSADIFSLQYVSFAFQPKGLPFGLSRHLRYLNPAAQWHIMFHELWVGVDKQSPVKMKLWGRLQKGLIVSMLTKLRPRFVHTHIALYKLLLERTGHETRQLPLFSNIPEYATGTAPSDCLRFVLFANIHHGAPVKAFALDLAGYQSKQAIPIRVAFAGRCGPEEAVWIKRLNAQGISTEALGPQQPETISHILAHSHFGITTTPYVLAGKSGAVAAMLLHGLPVICVSRAWYPAGFDGSDILEEGIREYIPGFLGEFINGPPGPGEQNTASVIAENFLSDIQKQIPWPA